MVYKYARRKGSSIDSDYDYYLGKENLYGMKLGWNMKPNLRRKAEYIWQTLLKQYYPTKYRKYKDEQRRKKK